MQTENAEKILFGITDRCRPWWAPGAPGGKAASAASAYTWPGGRGGSLAPLGAPVGLLYQGYEAASTRFLYIFVFLVLCYYLLYVFVLYVS